MHNLNTKLVEFQLHCNSTFDFTFHVRLSQHLDDDSLVEDGTAWRSPLERFAFYIKVLADLQGNE